MCGCVCSSDGSAKSRCWMFRVESYSLHVSDWACVDVISLVYAFKTRWAHSVSDSVTKNKLFIAFSISLWHRNWKIQSEKRLIKVTKSAVKMLKLIAETLLVRRSSQSMNGVVALNKRMSSHFTYQPDDRAPIDGPTSKLNMYQAINSALDTALNEDESAIIFGEDVGFGGVFRCTMDLQVIFHGTEGIKYWQIISISTEKIR